MSRIANVTPQTEERGRSSETERLNELYSYSILDSGKDEEYDSLTELAAKFFSVDACMISFVDKDRQWIKSRYGIEVRETHRKMSVCSYGITAPTPLVIEDVLLEPRYSNTLMMQMEPKYRFYAGAPLTTCSGYKLGMFCIMDCQPRKISESELRDLERFARLVVSLLDTRRLVSDVLKQVKMLRDIHERVELNYRLSQGEQTA